MPLGERIRELREERDLSLRELAKKLDCSAAFLSDIELGRRFPSEKNLKDLAQILNVPFDELKAHDSRPPIEELKRRSAEDPQFALAFRTALERNITADDLLKLAKSKHGKKK